MIAKSLLQLSNKHTSSRPKTQCNFSNQEPRSPHSFQPTRPEATDQTLFCRGFPGQETYHQHNHLTSRSYTTARRNFQRKRVMGFFSRKKDEVKKEKSSFGFSKPISSTPYVPNVVGDDDNDWPTKPPKKQQASGRDRFKPRNGPKYPPTRDGNTRDGFRSRQTRASMQILAALPPAVLERIFTFICPHSQDESYETCEQSAVDDACMLCDLRDLAYAGLACKKWRASAIKVMYVHDLFLQHRDYPPTMTILLFTGTTPFV